MVKTAYTKEEAIAFAEIHDARETGETLPGVRIRRIKERRRVLKFTHQLTEKDAVRGCFFVPVVRKIVETLVSELFVSRADLKERLLASFTEPAQMPFEEMPLLLAGENKTHAAVAEWRLKIGR